MIMIRQSVITSRIARIRTFIVMAAAVTVTAGCMSDTTPKHLKPLSAAGKARLANLGIKPGAALYVRIHKAERELEAWVQSPEGSYKLFRTYDICRYSGKLGPKIKTGDKQAPEGFYVVRPGQMNPRSKYHLSFNMGYPNIYDRAYKRTGAHLMVHGGCSSAGCYAMTDSAVQEIFGLARDAFMGGQREFHIHAFPFRMTESNMKRHKENNWYAFWQNLKEGYDFFEKTKRPPLVGVYRKRYVFFDPAKRVVAKAGTRMIVDRPNHTPIEVLAAAGIDTAKLSGEAAPQSDEAFLINASQRPEPQYARDRDGNH